MAHNRDTDEGMADAAEAVERRHSERRTQDVVRVAALVALGTTLLSAGVTYGLTTAKVDSKADKEEFHVHVVAETTMVNSIRAQLTRIENKQDSSRARLTSFLCEGKPKYCQ